MPYVLFINGDQVVSCWFDLGVTIVSFEGRDYWDMMYMHFIMSPSIKVMHILLCPHLIFWLYCYVFTIILVETYIVVL